MKCCRVPEKASTSKAFSNVFLSAQVAPEQARAAFSSAHVASEQACAMFSNGKMGPEYTCAVLSNARVAPEHACARFYRVFSCFLEPKWLRAQLQTAPSLLTPWRNERGLLCVYIHIRRPLLARGHQAAREGFCNHLTFNSFQYSISR